MNILTAVTLGAVYIYIYISYNLTNKKIWTGFNPALGKVYARDE